MIGTSRTDDKTKVEIIIPHGCLKTLSLRLLGHLEYQNVLDSGRYDAYKAGGEIRLLEILAVRGGYYYENIPDEDGGDSWNGETTYGLGLGLPISRLGEDAPPLRVSLDWVTHEDPERYSVYTLCIDWFF